MDGRLFVVADGLMNLHKYGIFYVSKLRKDEINIIVDTAKQCGIKLNVNVYHRDTLMITIEK